MILFFPYVFLFSFFLFLSLFLVVASPSWLMAWLFLELNLLMIIPLMVFGKQVEETESGIKYFLAQVVGSVMILLGAFKSGIETVFLFGVLIKLGVAPLHFWVPSVLSGMTWDLVFILLALQKIPLLVLLLYLDVMVFNMLVLVSIFSAILGGVMGINQVYLRPLLAYSSISHSGWLVAFSIVSSSVMWFYFLIYCFILLGMVKCLKDVGAVSFINYFWGINSIFLVLFLLSLGGLPPFSGFASKLVGILSLSSGSGLLVFLLVLGSLLSLYYYLCVAFFFIYQDMGFVRLQLSYMSMIDSMLVLMSSGLFFCLTLVFFSFCALVSIYQS